MNRMPHDELFGRLRALVETHGVSGSETAVAAEVQRQLVAAGFPSDALQSDTLGSRWLALGPDGEPQRLLVAHLDEIGLRISSIRPDGLCRVVPIGGIDPQLWEGTAVVVHTEGGGQRRPPHQVPGCIAPVSLHVTQRQGLGPKHRLEIHELLLDLGCTSAQEVAGLGVALLDSVNVAEASYPCRAGRLAGAGAQPGRPLRLRGAGRVRDGLAGEPAAGADRTGLGGAGRGRLARGKSPG